MLSALIITIIVLCVAKAILHYTKLHPRRIHKACVNDLACPTCGSKLMHHTPQQVYSIFLYLVATDPKRSAMTECSKDWTHQCYIKHDKKGYYCTDVERTL